ncbi:MAG: hypothetical protein WDO12_06440 [Pseudomonadota bacterium]
MTRLNHWAASVALIVLGSYASQSFAAASCNRACLRSALDRYLEAVVSKDPSKAPLAIGVRQTVNSGVVATGKGVWQSVTGLGAVQRKYFDPVSGQAGFYGTLKEGEETPIVTIRLRIEDRKITEAEWYVARENDPGLGGPRKPGGPPANNYNAEYLTQNPPPQRVVPEDKRVDRAALIRIADSYFDAITSHDRSAAQVFDGCGRAENGGPAPAGAFLPPAPPRANVPAGPPAPGPGAQPGRPSDCLTGMENFNAAMVAARRIPLVDVDAQIVMAMGVFIRKPGSPTPRNVASWWFVVDDAKIRVAYTAMYYPAPELPVPGWPAQGSDGNWPLPATIVPAPAPAR